MDSRLTYPKLPVWQKGFNQALQGTDLHTISSSIIDAQTNYDFELPSTGTLLFGPMSGFLINGIFETKAAEAADNAFTRLSPANGADVSLIPNWFEHLIEDLTVYHCKMPILAHDVPKKAEPFLNTYLYAHMHSENKDCLFPEPSNPGRCIGHSEKDWSLTDESSMWRKYANEAFKNGEITFRYVPPFIFPFYQHPNLSLFGKLPAAVPMPAVGKMSVNLRLKEKSDGIFKRKENNLNVYRFRIQKILLKVEEARLNLTFERKFLSRKESIVYPGVTHFGSYENIRPGALNYKCKLANVSFPEGVFVCALPKETLGPNYKWAPENNNVFLKHNIDNMKIFFQNKMLSLRSPGVGDFKDHMMGIKQLLDYRENPPFGVRQEPGISIFNTLSNGGESTLYPHLYFNLTPSGNESRIIPAGDDGHILGKRGDLDIVMNFAVEGATNDAVYMVYIFYTDASILFDMKTKEFRTLYKIGGAPE